MIGSALVGLVAGEMINVKRSIRHFARRCVVRGAAWSCTLLVFLGALLCFISAGYHALRLALPPIAAWSILGGVLLVVGLIAAVTLLVLGSRERS